MFGLNFQFMANETKIFYKPLCRTGLENTAAEMSTRESVSPNQINGMHVVSIAPSEPAKLLKSPRLKV